MLSPVTVHCYWLFEPSEHLKLNTMQAQESHSNAFRQDSAWDRQAWLVKWSYSHTMPSSSARGGWGYLQAIQANITCYQIYKDLAHVSPARVQTITGRHIYTHFCYMTDGPMVQWLSRWLVYTQGKYHFTEDKNATHRHSKPQAGMMVTRQPPAVLDNPLVPPILTYCFMQ